jgi:hypothetical protein
MATLNKPCPKALPGGLDGVCTYVSNCQVKTPHSPRLSSSADYIDPMVFDRLTVGRSGRAIAQMIPMISNAAVRHHAMGLVRANASGIVQSHHWSASVPGRLAFGAVSFHK